MENFTSWEALNLNTVKICNPAPASPRHSRSDATYLFLGAFLVAIAAIAVTGVNRVEFADAYEYTAAAKMLLERFDYPNEGQLYFFRPPLYPIFLAIIWKIVPGSIVAVKVIQAGFFALTCCVIYRIASVVTQDRMTAILSGLICMLNPFLIMQTTDIQTESFGTLLFAAGVLFAVRAVLEADFVLRKAALAGIAFGLTALCRPSALYIGIAVLLGAALLIVRKLSIKSGSLFCGVSVSLMFLTILPWTYSNYLRTKGEFILINDAGGYALWVGNVPEAARFYFGEFENPKAFMDYMNYVNEDLAREKVAEWENTIGFSKLSLNERKKLWTDEAIRNMREDPGITFELWVGKTWAFWKPYLNPTAYSWKVVAISATYFVPLYILAVIGMFILRDYEGGKEWVILSGILFLAATLLHAVVLGMTRYRVTYVDAYLAIFAAVPLTSLWRWIGEGREVEAFK